MVTVTFSGDTLKQLEHNIRAFLGDSAGVQTDTTPAPKPDARPLPSWAPAGAYWVEMPGAPVLRDAAGNMIVLDWSGPEPKPLNI